MFLSEKIHQNNKNISQSQLEPTDCVNLLNEIQAIAKIGYWENDFLKKRMYWSTEIFKIFGLNPVNQRPSKKIFDEIIHPEDQGMDKHAYEKHLKTGLPYQIECRIKLKNRKIKYILKKCTSIIDDKGKIIKSTGIIQDITKNKKNEIKIKQYQKRLDDQFKIRTKQLRNERDRAQKYLDIADVIFLILDKQQNIVLINKKGLETLGYTNEKEITGLNWFDNFVPERMRNKRKQEHNNICRKKIPPNESYENSVITKTGEEKIISWKNTLITNDKGIVTGILSSGEDITRRLVNEKIINERTAELEMFNKSMIGREMRIVELKEEINALASSTNNEIPYPEIWINK